jgi:cysteine desulfurase/selenocysteine lyase
MDPIKARNLFPLTQKCIFMDHAGVSPMSDRVRAALSGLTEELTRKPAPPTLTEEAADPLRRGLSRLLEVRPESIAITRGAAHGVSLLAQGLDWRPGDNVVGSELAHPAIFCQWTALADRGVEFRQAKLEQGRLTPDALFSLVDDRTRVVALSHVQHWNGCRIDLGAIGRECDRRGIIFAVEAIHSAGALRLPLSKLPVDFLAADAGKWLMGPAGAGFCYCRPELLKRLRPGLTSSSPAASLEKYLDSQLEYRNQARCLEESPLSILDTVAFGVAVDLLLDVGPKVIEKRVLSLSQQLAAGLAAQGYEVVEPWPRRVAESSGIVSFRRPGATAQEVMRDLYAAGIIGRVQADHVQLSPHFYTTDEDVTRVLDVLAPQGVATV